jgi:hypothetical protein
MKKRRYEIEGQGWLTISRAAELLRTNAQGVRKMMGDGSLDWRQTRLNSRTFVVSEQQVMTMRVQMPPAAPKRKAKVESCTFEPIRRQRGHAWTAHHLRLTLPRQNEEEKKKPD